jgi:hypothetical protein
MGRMTSGKLTFYDVVLEADNFGEELGVYALMPWNKDSVTIVCHPEEQTGLFAVVDGIRYDYLIQISILCEIFDGLSRMLGREATIDEKCDRIIEYAMDDA